MQKLRQFIQNCKSVLCLNGDISNIEKLPSNLPIIAADGAANKLLNLNIIPQTVIGDLDSFDILKAAKLNINQPDIVHDPSQYTSDFQKAMLYLKAKSLLPAAILGVNGGYIDHIINNINIFSGTGCVFIDNSIVGLTITPLCTSELILSENTKISIMGMPKCYVTSTGLKWELDNTLLMFPGYNSCFNRTVSERITLSVKDGTALAFIYLESIVDCGI